MEIGNALIQVYLSRQWSISGIARLLATLALGSNPDNSFTTKPINRPECKGVAVIS